MPETLPLEQWVRPGLLVVGLEGGFGLVTPRVGTRLVEEPWHFRSKRVWATGTIGKAAGTPGSRPCLEIA